MTYSTHSYRETNGLLANLCIWDLNRSNWKIQLHSILDRVADRELLDSTNHRIFTVAFDDDYLQTSSNLTEPP